MLQSEEICDIIELGDDDQTMAGSEGIVSEAISGGGAAKLPDFSQKFTIFTDGSALNNKASAPAGCAVYIPSVKRLLSKSMLATNNQAELEAIRYALWWFKENGSKYVPIPDNKLYIFTDSNYSMNAISGKWKKLKENMPKITVCRRLIHDIKTTYKISTVFIHVRAHTRKKDFVSINNDIVDQEARRQATEMKSGE